MFRRLLLPLEPLLLAHGADFYFCGHNHNFETTWPLRNNTLVQKSFDNPAAPFYVVSGAAGRRVDKLWLPLPVHAPVFKS